ncbi:MAG TPA: hypothetical protein VFG73_02645 [Rhodanobacteraceae bacterium]|nr:hypothetical protein [Rhodanobacteraceae bacterium]
MTKMMAAALAVLLLGGCASTPEWEQARAVPPLTIPAGLDKPGVSSEMVVPKIGDSDLPPPRSTRPPASDRSIVLASGVDAAYQQVGAVLEAAKVGAIVTRDAAQHLYRLKLTQDEVQPPPSSFWHRLFHAEPDTSGLHYADISILPAANGNSTVAIDGDALAVARLHRLLDAHSTVVNDSAADSDNG